LLYNDWHSIEALNTMLQSVLHLERSFAMWRAFFEVEIGRLENCNTTKKRLTQTYMCLMNIEALSMVLP
jgi:hypothetical protein